MELYHPNKKARIPLSLRIKHDPAWNNHELISFPPSVKEVKIKDELFLISPDHESLLTKYSWYLNGGIPYTTLSIPFIEGALTPNELKHARNRKANGSYGKIRKFKISWIYLVKGLFPDIPGRLIARENTPKNNLHPDNYVLVPPGRVGNDDFKPRYHNVQIEISKECPTSVIGLGTIQQISNLSVPSLGATPVLQDYKEFARRVETDIARTSDKSELIRNGSLGSLNFLDTVGIRI